MLIDGIALANKIKKNLAKNLKSLDFVPTLAVIIVGDNKASKKYVEKKRAFGEELGVKVKPFEYEENISERELLSEVERLAVLPEITGIIIQLPLPDHIDTQRILDAVPSIKDVDALGGSPKVLSPVVGSIQAIIDEYKIDVRNKKTVVVGRGKLVGRPLSIWLATLGAEVEAIDARTGDIVEYTKKADILILGTGSPYLINPDMIKDGVVLIDAGTSEADSKLLGDATPTCADKCSLFTPVPGGVGPLTVAMLFDNLLQLAKENNNS